MADRCSHLRLAKGLCNQCEEDTWGRLAVLLAGIVAMLIWWVIYG